MLQSNLSLMTNLWLEEKAESLKRSNHLIKKKKAFGCFWRYSSIHSIDKYIVLGCVHTLVWLKCKWLLFTCSSIGKVCKLQTKGLGDLVAFWEQKKSDVYRNKTLSVKSKCGSMKRQTPLIVFRASTCWTAGKSNNTSTAAVILLILLQKLTLCPIRLIHTLSSDSAI